MPSGVRNARRILQSLGLGLASSGLLLLLRWSGPAAPSARAAPVGRCALLDAGGPQSPTATAPSTGAGHAEGRREERGPVRIVVDMSQFRLDLFVQHQLYKTYPIAIGRPSPATNSPIGEWRVTEKSIEAGSEFGTRWIGLNVPWGSYGIHGTSQPWSIGRRASAGCIRMFNYDVEEVYEWVAIGTRVQITGKIPTSGLRRRLVPGSVGEDVVYVQIRLDELGFGAQGADGRYGTNTTAAVRRLQRLYGLPEDGFVSPDVYEILGLSRDS